MYKLNKDQEIFKSYLKKIGSGELTSKSLTREESAHALNLILHSKATPAQIGAFLVAHRIRRPEPQEMAGMIDMYLKLGPTIKSKKSQRRPICFGMPFDGRNRIAPIYPLTSLILLSYKQPVFLQGGSRMPTKYGITSLELFESLGIKIKGKKLYDIEKTFHKFGFAFIYQPDHFSIADNLIRYREELGKRPPIASMELLWTAHEGEHLIISGFVHTPTEQRAWETLKLRGEGNFISIKGHEGSIDLPTSRECITGYIHNNEVKRLTLNPKEYNLSGKDIKLINISEWKSQAFEALNNEGPLKDSLIWNAGVYLWLAGITNNLSNGIKKAQHSLTSGSAQECLKQLIEAS